MELGSSKIGKFENKVWLILLAVIIFFVVSSFFVYASLSKIVNDISEEARPDETVILMKEVLYVLSDAENNVKSYSLTKEPQYLDTYNANFDSVEGQIERLKVLTAEDKESRNYADSLELLINEKFYILEDLLILQGQSRVSSALDKVVDQIGHNSNNSNSHAENSTTISTVEQPESAQEAQGEEKFFKKLINKRKKKDEEVLPENQETSDNLTVEQAEEPKDNISVDRISHEISQIKKEEERIDKSTREKELMLIHQDKEITDQILGIFYRMEEKETLSMEEKLALADSNSLRTKWLIAIFCLLACVLLVFAGYAVNTYVKRNDAFKIALRRAKAETDAKNREITDSIMYAQKIQEAILPDRKLFREFLQDSFILYKPKDIVAGDFYWTVNLEGTTFVGVGDCTGHGVPGAMVSVVCSTALNRSVREFGLTKPADILEKCRQLVIETFASGNYSVNDGMDIALISLRYEKEEDRQVAVIEYAGANNSLYVVNNGNLQDIRPDKQPIGKYQFQVPFTNHKLVLDRGAMLYLFSDGYADQFGGPHGKKFKYKPFQELLSGAAKLEMNMQLHVLEDNFERWRGALEQIDDVCVIGVRV